jgi:hypothetical protein
MTGPRAFSAWNAAGISFLLLLTWNDPNSCLGGGGTFVGFASANPLSNPFVAFRTSAFEGQENFVDLALILPDDPRRSVVHKVLRDVDHTVHVADDPQQGAQIFRSASDGQCHLLFSLGISKRVHGDWSAPIVAPPVVYPALPGAGPGRQVLLTQYEHLDMLSPSAPFLSSNVDANNGRRHRLPPPPPDGSGTGRRLPPELSGGGVKEVMLQSVEFPLLLEGSTFWTSPVLVDSGGDGRPQAILTDSAGGIYVVGLTTTTPPPQTSGTTTASAKRRHRSFQAAQVPRLFVRREWVEGRIKIEMKKNGSGEVVAGDAAANEGNSSSTNVTNAAPAVEDPYHTYFEYYYSGSHDRDPSGKLLQGVSANAWSQESADRQRLLERRRRQRQEGRDKQRAAQHVGQPHDHEHPGAAAAAEHEGEDGPKRIYDDDFVGDDLEYMLAKQRIMEEREGQVDDAPRDVEPRHENHEGSPVDQVPKEENSQRRRLTEKGEGVAEGGNAVHDREGNLMQKKLHDPPDVDADHVEQVEGEEGGLFYDDLAADGGGRGDKLMMNDITDVDKQESTDDLIGGNDVVAHDDPKYGMHYDDYYKYRHGLGGGGDDTYSAHNERHREYYDTKHYIRIPPHVLCTPVLAELPKLYSNTDEKEDILFVAVSYFVRTLRTQRTCLTDFAGDSPYSFPLVDWHCQLDEDEYDGLTGYKRFTETDHGDETEASRGMYVASAIMAYVLGESPRWTGQTHLDLSTDYTAPENLTVVGTVPIRADRSGMGAFALGSPTVADIDGDGNMEVLIGTSMGFVYAFDARQMYKKNKFPIQLPHPVESRILVEDVRGDTNLEIFVADTGGHIVCFSHEAIPLWNRDLATSLDLMANDVQGSSPMTLGDVNGDGVLDLAVAVLVQGRSFMFVLNAATGEDLEFFPIEFDSSHFPKSRTENVHHKLTQPLLVDLHQDQSFIKDYIRRNGTAWSPRKARSTTPGSASGLHIVYPQDQYLFIIEGGSGCNQVIPIGDPISAMVQVDDVHGTNRLDLIVSTEAGDVITLESPSPYHPLNTWSQGELRGRTNGHAHGYSASQGIYVHERSRQYVDIFGVYVPITFEIFDNRPNIQNEDAKRQYLVEVRDGPSSKRALFRAKYDTPGVYTERFYIRYGPGYYTLHVTMLTSHGLLYEDTYHIGYNVRFMDGFGTLLWLPLLVAALTIVLFGSKKSNWDDDDEVDSDREGHSLGILGRTLPS